ncbi:YIP1 family protein [Sphingomonas koreensis]|uniref:YIP1 family protein n=4 Tax=Sphingomonas koreensis TaxID=93064 RepID=A0AAJ4VAW0_9SPHN|nr:YIP1 family protein [Sphingomonas koreensis]RSU33266.1 YIP1 family protein [Sphingomonas koreensis]RSU37581.1 YIP1 family protein [Sphingomonas koreensis]RSU43583.1 YIP1 family protein [Sphingomonas koreensis]RSU80018.1 YIP1 family protein [Sphingomonas koreensis]
MYSERSTDREGHGMTGETSSNLIERIKNILLKPKEEWERIDAEPATVGGLMTGWVVPLAAIGPVAGLIGGLVFGYGGMFGITIRPSVTMAVTGAVISYLLALLCAWLFSKIIDALAPSFGGQKNPVQAMKVAAYSGTAAYLAGVFQIIPALGILGLLGLYSLYLLYLGLPRLMKAPADKAMGYTIVTVVVAIVLFFVVSVVTGALTSLVAPRAITSATMSGEVSVPGVGKVDLSKLEEASKKMEAAAERAQTATPVDRQALAALLPASAGGWTRTALESSTASAGGMGGSQAEARYEANGQSVRLKVADLAAAGAFAAMASAFKVETSREDDQGYEKSGLIDGRYTMEKWNKSGSGSYGVLLKDRFLVEAEGNVPDIGTLKALVGAVDAGKLEALAN